MGIPGCQVSGNHKMRLTTRIKNTVAFLLLVSAWIGRSAHADIIYVAEATRISSISPTGEVSSFVTNDLAHPIGRPTALGIDSHGNFFTTNGVNQLIKITPGGVSSVFFNSNLSLPPNQNVPESLAIDRHDNIYVANAVGGFGGCDIVKFAPDGSRSLFASGFKRAEGVAVDSNGTVYVSDVWDNSVSKITPSGVSTILATGLNEPAGLTVATNGDVYVANYGANSIIKISGGVQSIYTTVSSPSNLVFDSVGNLYVDSAVFNGTVKRITPDGIVSVFASGLNQPAGIVAQVPEPSSLIVLGLGILTMIVGRRCGPKQ